MKKITKICTVLLISIFTGLLNTCTPAEASIIEVDPAVIDFGDVELNTTAENIITVMNTGFGAVSITSIDISGSSSFQISNPPSLPVSLNAPESLYITISFSPTIEGYVSAILTIAGSNGETFAEQVALGGMGVTVSQPPASVAEILAFFDASAADNSLVGSGPGNSAAGRMKALRNMIEAAGDLIENGQIDKARQQLQDTYLRTDGQPQPPDFVSGPAAPQLAEILLNFINSL